MNSFRKIRPSFGDKSTSTSTPNTSDYTGSNSHRACNDGEVEGSTKSSLKRRRAPGSVTCNACMPCKKARAKCDGNKPCKRCDRRAEGSNCIYEAHLKIAKEELVKQIKELGVKVHLTEQILKALSSNGKITEILDRLREGKTYESIVEWLDPSPTADFETFSPRDSRRFRLEMLDQEIGGMSSADFQWTTVTSNKAVIDHLCSLYFSWVHPVHTLFSEGHFMESFDTLTVDEYCSPVLLNAICAMACHLHSISDSDDIDFKSLGREFSKAVRTEIDSGDERITTTQAFAIMFLVESARANALRAAAYLRIAIKRLKNITGLEIKGFTEIWMNTVRGTRNLNVEWSLATFQVPLVIVGGPSEDFGDSEDEVHEATIILDARNWYFYRSVNDTCPAFPSLLATTNREKSKLMSIISDMATKMYTQQGEFLTANDVLQLYSRLVQWREELPSSIGNTESESSQVLPHVLSMLILHSNALIHLLCPLLDFEGFPSTLVQEVVWNTAQEGLFLLDEHYLSQYTCRYQPVLQMFGVLQLTDVIYRFFPNSVDGPSKGGAAAIQFGIEVLLQSYRGIPVAGLFQEMLRRTASECSFLPPNPPRFPKEKYRLDDFIDACTRPSYVQPTKEIHHRYLPSFSVDWAADGGPYGFHEPAPGRKLRGTSAEERGALNLMQIRNLLNAN